MVGPGWGQRGVVFSYCHIYEAGLPTTKAQHIDRQQLICPPPEKESHVTLKVYNVPTDTVKYFPQKKNYEKK